MQFWCYDNWWTCKYSGIGIGQVIAPVVVPLVWNVSHRCQLNVQHEPGNQGGG